MARGIKEIKNEIFKLVLEFKEKSSSLNCDIKALKFEINGKIANLNAEIAAIRSARVRKGN